MSKLKGQAKKPAAPDQQRKGQSSLPRFDYQTFDNRSFSIKGDELRRPPAGDRKVKSLSHLNLG